MTQWWIQIENGAAGLQRIPFVWQGARVGSAADCEIRLADPTVPAHAVTILSRDDQFFVYPADSIEASLGESIIDSGGAAWTPGEILTIGHCRLRLLLERPPGTPASRPRPSESAAPREPQAKPPRAAQTSKPKSATRNPAPIPPAEVQTKPDGDQLKVLLVAALLVAAMGIVFWEPSAVSSGEGSGVTIEEVLKDLSQQQPDRRQPELRQIREQLWSAYRSEGNRVAAREQYEVALQMLLSRAVSGTPTTTSSMLGSEAKRYNVPVQFDSPVEYKIYACLRDKLASEDGQ